MGNRQGRRSSGYNSSNLNSTSSNTNSNSMNDEEPEWFSGGPTSQNETIELRGFDETSDIIGGNSNSGSGKGKKAKASKNRYFYFTNHIF